MQEQATKCRHWPWCNCVQEGGVPARQISEYKGGKLAGGPIPICHVDLRDFSHNKNNKDCDNPVE